MVWEFLFDLLDVLLSEISFRKKTRRYQNEDKYSTSIQDEGKPKLMIYNQPDDRFPDNEDVQA